MEFTLEEEKKLIQKFFESARQNLSHYAEERNLQFSNAQLFAIVMVSPITIAIASDGNLDLTEVSMLVDIAAYFDRDVLPVALDEVGQPEGVMSNEEFRRIVYSELKYLAMHMKSYESEFIQTLKDLIELDETLSKEDGGQLSVKKKIVEMMHGVIYNNLGSDSIEEAQVTEVLKQLNLA